MIKTFTIILSVVLVVLMIDSISWFEQEQEKIETINKKHIEDIEKLKKIKQINVWLDSIVKSKLKILSESEDEAEYHLVNYFDDNTEVYNFQVNRYMYNDNDAKNLNITYSVDRDNTSKLNTLMSILYKDGFLQFRKFEMNKKNIKGEIQLIQPYNGDNNAS
ncbi:MAG: hypothetical protein OQK45_08670 [Sulfurovum sp.]|nr:hypothetical protein [Sulfurovum sp.]